MCSVNKNGGRSGAALVLVFVVTLVMSILVAAVYILFSSNVSTQEYAMNRIGARFTAEAGARLAVHELSLDTELPVDTDPFYMPGDSSGWITIPGVQGRALVVIDPRNNVSNPWAVRGVEIRSRGSVGSGTMDVSMHFAPDAPSRYALLVDDGIPAGFFTDGRVVQGPVRSNGVIHFSSTSSDSMEDPFVEEVSTASENGFHFSDAGYSDVPHPDGSAVWVRPYRNHLAGSPTWNTSISVLDFDRISEHFGDLLNEASEMGTVVSGVKRMIIDGNTLLIRTEQNGPITFLELGDGRDLVFVLNGSMPVYLKSGQPTTVPLTIVATGSVYICGHIRGSAAGSDGPLAIVSLGDIIMPSDPAYTGGEDWSTPWDIETEGNLGINAYLAAPHGQFRSENILYPPGESVLIVYGGLMAERLGIMGSSMSGSYLSIEYDQGLKSVMPPHFPLLENWIMTSWMEDPDYSEIPIESDMF